MLKKVQVKIVLIFFIVGILMIGIMGLFFIGMLNNVSSNIQEDNINSTEQAVQIVGDLTQKTQIVLGISAITFTAIVALLGVLVSKLVVKPVSNTFDMMTDELKDKLNEVSKQKNQIETILLHMTDGIIAFDMQGEIILINPAAKKSLKISPEDNSFDDIFKKCGAEINMEKIIYLENWTSTEQRVKIEDKYMHIFFVLLYFLIL